MIKNTIFLLMLALIYSCNPGPVVTLYVKNKYASGNSRIASFYQRSEGMRDCYLLGLEYEKSGYKLNCTIGKK